MEWFRKSAEQGFPEAQYNLGYAFANGEGVPKNLVSALMWFTIADANGLQQGGETAKEAKQFMNLFQIAEARRRTRRCLNSNYQDCD